MYAQLKKGNSLTCPLSDLVIVACGLVPGKPENPFVSINQYGDRTRVSLSSHHILLESRPAQLFRKNDLGRRNRYIRIEYVISHLVDIYSLPLTRQFFDSALIPVTKTSMPIEERKSRLLLPPKSKVVFCSSTSVILINQNASRFSIYGIVCRCGPAACRSRPLKSLLLQRASAHIPKQEEPTPNPSQAAKSRKQ